jgi:hypothetical protein
MHLQFLVAVAAFSALLIQITLMLIAKDRSNPQYFDLLIFVAGVITLLLFATSIGIA